jgi:phosphoadenosine phosphosulfate reductase
MRTQEEIAIDRIQTFQPDALGFSGGKDSVVCDELMRRSGLSYTAWMNLTTVDPKIHVDFVRQNFPHVALVHPDKGVSMYSLIRDKGLPSRKIRFCCEFLKERIVHGSFVVFGVRQAESNKRRNRPMFHYHPKDKRIKVLNPIIDWTDQDVWRYIHENHLPISPLYQPPYNFNRVGCIGCPMSNRGMTRQFRLFPEYKRLYIFAIKARMKRGKFPEFESPEQVFEWWISQINKNQFLSQMSFCMD